MSLTRFLRICIKTGGRLRRAQEDEESGEESEEEEEVKKSSATEGLIEVSPPWTGPPPASFYLSPRPAACLISHPPATQTANPNAPKKEAVKASQVDVDAPQELTRRERCATTEPGSAALGGAKPRQALRRTTVHADADCDRPFREAIEKQRSEAAYWKAHEKGETDEARHDGRAGRMLRILRNFRISPNDAGEEGSGAAHAYQAGKGGGGPQACGGKGGGGREEGGGGGGCGQQEKVVAAAAPPHGRSMTGCVPLSSSAVGTTRTTNNHTIDIVHERGAEEEEEDARYDDDDVVAIIIIDAQQRCCDWQRPTTAPSSTC